MRIPARHIAAPLVALTLLSACGSDPEPAPEPPASEEIAPVETTPPPAPPPAPVANVLEEAPPPVEQLEPDEQVLEDADASGMTARVERGEEPADSAVTE